MKQEDNFRQKRSHNIISVIGINKKISLNLIGLDGNAFNLMGSFSRQARKEGWSEDEISYVIEKCTEIDGILYC